MNIDDIPQGESWAVQFRVTTFLQDGTPVRPAHLAIGEKHPGVPGEYTGIGIIQTRDRAARRLKLIDSTSHLDFTVPYEDVWNPEPIEWIEHESE